MTDERREEILREVVARLEQGQRRRERREAKADVPRGTLLQAVTLGVVLGITATVSAAMLVDETKIKKTLSPFAGVTHDRPSNNSFEGYVVTGATATCGQTDPATLEAPPPLPPAYPYRPTTSRL